MLTEKGDENEKILKAHLVAREFEKVGCEEGLRSPVPKITTLRMFLSICATYNLKMQHADVKNAYLNGKINKMSTLKCQNL